MILIGRYLSPFVRRVAVTLQHYGIDYEHRPLMAFGEDKEKLKATNPLARVPALVLDDGECLVDSAAMLDYLDERVGPDKALLPRTGDQRRRLLTLLGIATGAVEKAVLTVYEVRLRPEDKRHPPFVEMCATQAKDGLEYLDGQFQGPWFGGDHMTQVDVSAVCYWQFIQLANPGLADGIEAPNLASLSERAKEIEAFKRTAPQ